MTRPRGATAALVLALACAEPTLPSRAGTYRFDLGGEVFHWPPDRLPVRFYATPAGNMRFLVRRAVHSWEGVFLYGEFQGQLVSDSAVADVIVVWTDSVPPDVPPDTGPAVFACSGVTSFPAVDVTTNRYRGPVQIRLSVFFGYTEGQVAACMRRTAIHEVGHALGLFLHSPSSGDIMYAPPQIDFPSEQDRRTAEVLYHTAPTILPASR